MPLARTLSTWTLRAALTGAVAAAVLAVAPALWTPSATAAQGAPVAAALLDVAPSKDGKLQTAIVSGGCFWGVQGVFQHVKGVTQAVSGYDGGDKATAHYEVVGTGLTGHAETVKITYDPKQISYAQILRVFFSVATDPTQMNMQYPDDGTQYRNEIWTTNSEQRKVADAYIAQLNAAKAFPKKIATRVDPDKGFYRAEAYHQDFLRLHPTQGYIATFDMPKIAELKRQFPSLYRAQPIITAATS